MHILRNKVLVFLAFYLAIFYYFGGLNFELAKDELHFWPTVLEFSKSYNPSLETLRNYNELNTPLPFYLFGIIEKVTQAGPQAGRILNFLVSFVIIILIVANKGTKPLLFGIGLISFPYFLGTSIFLYTDIVCSIFVLTGYLAYKKNKPFIAMVLFVLAIASRQYMVAFPVGILAALVFSRKKDLPLFIAMSLATLSIIPWMLLWGDFAPPAAITAQNLANTSVLHVFPDHSLYFMSCLGFYFVIIEYFFKNGFQIPRLGSLKRILLILVITGAFFVVFPPLGNINYEIPTMGYLDKVCRIFLSDNMRMFVFFVLAALAVLRFSSNTPETWLFWANVGIMAKAHIGWDKYILPLLVCLWLSDAFNQTAIEAAYPRKVITNKIETCNDEIGVPDERSAFSKSSLADS